MSPPVPTFRLNFDEALRFIWRDPRWLAKLALGALFSLLSVIVVGGILTQGYLLLLAERVARAEPQPLPEWEEYGEILRQGFSGFVITLVLSIPLIVLGFIITLLYFPILFAGASGGQGAAAAAVGGVLILLLSLLFLPLALLVGIVGPAAHAQLVLHDGDLAAAFRFREIFAFMGRQRGQYALMLIISIAASGVLSQIGYFACFIGVFVTVFVAQLFQYHLIGQLCWYDRTVLTVPQRGE